MALGNKGGVYCCLPTIQPPRAKRHPIVGYVDIPEGVAGRPCGNRANENFKLHLELESRITYAIQSHHFLVGMEKTNGSTS